MDKAEYQVRLGHIKELVDSQDYEGALKIVQTIEWKRVKSVNTLCMVADIYEANGLLEDCKRILRLAYNRAPVGKTILSRLVELALKLGKPDEAADYYHRFVKAAPNDATRYLLKYKIYKAQQAPIEDLIDALRSYKDREYTERWAYELARLYSKAGMDEECVEECDDIILWFSEGIYVIRAMELKMKYTPLTPSQQEKYNNRYETTPELYEQAVAQPMPTAEFPQAGAFGQPQGMVGAQGTDTPAPAPQQQEEAFTSTVDLQERLSESLMKVIGGFVRNDDSPMGQEAHMDVEPETLENIQEYHDVRELEPEQLVSGSSGVRREAVVTRPDSGEAAGSADIDFSAILEAQVDMLTGAGEMADGMDEAAAAREQEENAEGTVDAAEIPEEVSAGEADAFGKTIDLSVAIRSETGQGEAAEEKTVSMEPEEEAARVPVSAQAEPAAVPAAGIMVQETMKREEPAPAVQEAVEPEAPVSAVQENVVREAALPEIAVQEAAEPEAVLPEAQAVETVKQEAAEPENVLPGTVEPEAVKREAVLPEPVLPGTAVGEAVTAEMVKPEAVLPEPVAGGAVASEIVKREAVLPEPAVREAVTPETVKQKTAEPEAVLPEPAVREAVTPETIKQKTAEPEAVLPGPAVREAATPETVKRETVEPEAVLPEPAVREAVTPETVKRETVEPEAVVPGREPAVSAAKAVSLASEAAAPAVLLQEETPAAPEAVKTEAPTVPAGEPRVPEAVKTVKTAAFETVAPDAVSAETKQAVQIPEPVQEARAVKSAAGTARQETPPSVLPKLRPEPEMPKPAELEAARFTARPERPETKSANTTVDPDELDLEALLASEVEQMVGGVEKPAPEPEKDLITRLEEEADRTIVHEEMVKETPQDKRYRIIHADRPNRFTEEQKRLFTYFAKIPGMDEQILEAIHTAYNGAVNKTSRRGNIAIMGRPGTGKTRLSEGLVRSLCKEFEMPAAKIAHIHAEKLNEKDVAKVVDKMSGGFLIIEQAGRMAPETIHSLSQSMEFRTDSMILLIEDDKQDMRQLLSDYPEFAEKFDSVISIPVFTNDELVTFARTYAGEQGYKMDEMGVLALYTIIGDNQKEDEPVSVAQVKEMVDFAIRKASRGGRRFGRKLSGRQTDENNRIILYEKDFNIK